MSSEIEIEPIPGLPNDLPPGERIVWQGSPQWKALARHTFKVRLLAGYFAVFAALRLVVAVREKQGAAGIRQVLIASALAVTCLGVLSLIAWMHARATIYTITTRRIVMRIGVAVPMTWNLPFRRLAAAQMKARSEGDGDIVLELKAPDRIAWLHLWPHTLPWHLTRARPTLRTIAEPARVAAILGDAVQSWAVEQLAPVLVTAPHAYEDDAASSPVSVDRPLASNVTPEPVRWAARSR